MSQTRHVLISVPSSEELLLLINLLEREHREAEGIEKQADFAIAHYTKELLLVPPELREAKIKAGVRTLTANNLLQWLRKIISLSKQAPDLNQNGSRRRRKGKGEV